MHQIFVGYKWANLVVLQQFYRWIQGKMFFVLSSFLLLTVLVSGEIYTVGKNFALTPALTNLTSGRVRGLRSFVVTPMSKMKPRLIRFQVYPSSWPYYIKQFSSKRDCTTKSPVSPHRFSSRNLLFPRTNLNGPPFLYIFWHLCNSESKWDSLKQKWIVLYSIRFL